MLSLTHFLEIIAGDMEEIKSHYDEIAAAQHSLHGRKMMQNREQDDDYDHDDEEEHVICQVYELVIDGTPYFVSGEKQGDEIFSKSGEQVGEKVGEFKEDGKPSLQSGDRSGSGDAGSGTTGSKPKGCVPGGCGCVLS